MEATFVIIGGGISGVSCAESIAFLAPEEKIVLISASPLVKTVTNIVSLGKTLTQFDVEEKSSSALTSSFPSITVLHDVAVKVDVHEKTVTTASGSTIRYQKLCLCLGARPKLICENNSRVLGIRDTESVENFREKLRGARKIVVVGNGGIATELVHEIKGLDIVWVIKDNHISATFVDPGAAEFFQDKLQKGETDEESKKPVKRMRYTVTNDTNNTQSTFKGGPALGPDWHSNFKFQDPKGSSSSVQIEYQSEVSRILEPSEVPENQENWPVYAQLTSGKIIGCDVVVSATGVVPNSCGIPGLESLKREQDEGYSVDWKLETSVKDVYAAGDVCSATWEVARHWFQMRLWTQAHQMGRYAAKCMLSTLQSEQFYQDFCFELFTHVTKFFGYKVVLLGLYNGQKLDNSYEILLRVTRGQEYVKLVLKDGKMQGAVLIGDTDLEEMCENLILNQLDLSVYGEDLLNPDIDIEDYFD